MWVMAGGALHSLSPVFQEELEARLGHMGFRVKTWVRERVILDRDGMVVAEVCAQRHSFSAKRLISDYSVMA
jgi:hypothetical protein